MPILSLLHHRSALGQDTTPAYPIPQQGPKGGIHAGHPCIHEHRAHVLRSCYKTFDALGQFFGVAKYALPEIGYVRVSLAERCTIHVAVHDCGQGCDPTTGKRLDEYLWAKVETLKIPPYLGHKPRLTAWIAQRATLRNRRNVYHFVR